MRIQITINDDTIRDDVVQTVEDMEQDGFIRFPADGDRAEFIADMTDCIIDKFLMYDDYMPNYHNEILDLADGFGYIVTD